MGSVTEESEDVGGGGILTMHDVLTGDERGSWWAGRIMFCLGSFDGDGSLVRV